MIKSQLIAIYVLFKNLLCPCFWDNKKNDFQSHKAREFKIERHVQLSYPVNESSGSIADPSDPENLLFINDSGGNPEFYKTTYQGCYLGKIAIPNAKNVDWEDLTSDDSGNIYAGDFGNNLNCRKNLAIYKFNSKDSSTFKIHYVYPDQLAFPPPKDSFNFDCEAFFWFNKSLYLISKNRGDKIVKLYKLKDDRDNQVAEIVDRIYLSAPITGAALAPDKKSFALISYGKIYIFNILNQEINFRQPYLCRPFRRSAQAESILFKNIDSLFVSNEAGKIFIVKRRTKNH